MKLWIVTIAAVSALSLAAWAAPSKRETRVCGAMKAYGELNSLSKNLVSDLEKIQPGLSAPDQDTALLLHGLSAADADRASAITCRWISGIASRLSRIDPVFRDLDSLSDDADAVSAAAELASATADGDLDEMFCNRASDLGKTPLPQDPSLTYSDYTIGILIQRVREQSEKGDAVSRDLWRALDRGYGISSKNCE